MYKNTIFWFRQDLRLFDNKGFIEAIKNSNNILPIFIFDTNIIHTFGGLSDKKFLFLKEFLIHLDNCLKTHGLSLFIYHGTPENIIPELIKKYNINAIFSNKTYGNYGKSRDEKTEQLCLKNHIDFYNISDYLLVEPEEVEQRKVFTPYFKLWKKALEKKGIQLLDYKKEIGEVHLIYGEEKNVAHVLLEQLITGGQHPIFHMGHLKKQIKNFCFEEYDNTRNSLDIDGTSQLSVYIRFGIISIRYLYSIVQNRSDSFVSELAWREFWQHINYYFPYTKKIEFQENKRHIQWKHDKELFEKWCQGETGYPIVDAAMKQLVSENWMHGRSRMIVASFLTKDLLIDWRWGEDFFKKYLLDYDENVNYGNWQWSASVGADPKPLRIFNPCLQSQKFDPEGKYIRKYIPQLKTNDITSIHSPTGFTLHNYTKIIVDHSIAQKIAREAYKRPS